LPVSVVKVIDVECISRALSVASVPATTSVCQCYDEEDDGDTTAAPTAAAAAGRTVQ